VIGLGVVAKNDFYENARANEGIGIEITDAEPTLTEPPEQSDTSIFQNVDSQEEQPPEENPQVQIDEQQPNGTSHTKRRYVGYLPAKTNRTKRIYNTNKTISGN